MISIIDFIKNKLPEAIRTATILKKSSEHIVLEINDTWIFRQAQNPQAQNHMATEVKFLKQVHSKISCAIPSVEYYFPEINSYGYKKISGTPLMADLYAQFTNQEKKQFAHNFAYFLHELHTSLTLQEAQETGLNAADWPFKPAELLQKINPKLDSSVASIFNTFIKKYQRIAQSNQLMRVVHNDLHPDNILVDPETKQLSGVIDFTSAAFDTPYHDFRYLHLIDIQLVGLAIEAYNQIAAQPLLASNAHIYCLATEFSRLIEAFEHKNTAKIYEIQKRIGSLAAFAL